MKYDLFLSYSFEEKEVIARPLAEELRALKYKVWFDGHVMNVGDSIKESIDAGIIKSECAVIIISHSYLIKEWTNYELNWFAARENLKGKLPIIPIWHNLSPEDVNEFISNSTGKKDSTMPVVVLELIKTLLDKPYINTELGISSLVAKIVKEVPLNPAWSNKASLISEADHRSFLQTFYTIELYNEWHWAGFKKSTAYIKNWINGLKMNGEKMISLSEIENIGGDLEYHVFEVIHFYEKWALLSMSLVIDKEQLFKLLSGYSRYFEDNLIRPLKEAEETNNDFVNLLNLIDREILNNVNNGI